jgi:glycosyltransferase involved in cell wall biosynthesis
MSACPCGEVTVVVPAHLPRFRNGCLDRALASVTAQQSVPRAVAVEKDCTHAGAAATRNAGLAKVTTEWVAFLDSDDTMNPEHLRLLTAHQRETGADLVYPWFDVVGGTDPFPDREGQPFDPELMRTRNTVPVTVLVRTDLLRDAGGFQPKGPPENPCDDWGAWEALLAAGAVFSHLDRRTWKWIWGDNTSGRGDRW